MPKLLLSRELVLVRMLRVRQDSRIESQAVNPTSLSLNLLQDIRPVAIGLPHHITQRGNAGQDGQRVVALELRRLFHRNVSLQQPAAAYGTVSGFRGAGISAL